MPASETSWSVKISADCHWDVTDIENDDWGELTVSPRSGDGNGTLVLTSVENHSSVDRTATIIISTTSYHRWYYHYCEHYHAPKL
jgi:hypothetical protein